MAREEGVLGGIAETDIAGIPVGAALTGALCAGVADGLIAMIPMKLPSAVVRGAASWGMIEYGPRVVGTTAAQTAGLFLAYDALQEIFNFRGVTRDLFRLRRRGGVSDVGDFEDEFEDEYDDDLELLGEEGDEDEIELIGDEDEDTDDLELLGFEDENELPPELLGTEVPGSEEVPGAEKLVLV